MSTPSSRIRVLNAAPIRTDGAYVLYWMIAARRTRSNFGLQRAVELANELGRPLLVLEAVRVAYPFASDRFHTFIIEGLRDNARAIAATKAVYYPYVERRPGEGRGLLRHLSAGAAVVVTDWFPAFFLPRMTQSAADGCDVRFEVVDGNGIIPVSTHGRGFPTARGYRAFVQRSLREHLAAFPDVEPLSRLDHAGAVIPVVVTSRWPAVDPARDPAAIAASLPIDHAVPPAPVAGGAVAAQAAMDLFVRAKLARYDVDGNHPDADATSRLSPYLHFGHLGAHELFAAVMTRERWTSRQLGASGGGAREGWWNVSAGAESFLDQLVVWRELAFNGCAWTPGYADYASLPAWARSTLEAHLDDPRPHLYSLGELDAAATADPVWNAAQNELRTTGWFHGYMRMVWGKKILEWSRHPAEALERMEILMNRYSLDGRDPVSYLNYGWVLGRHDRPWFERPIFGTVRYMTSESAKRKLKMKKYLASFAPVSAS